MIEDIRADLDFVRHRWKKSPARVVLTGRGFHALLLYRAARWLREKRVPLLPLLLTRAINILYAIDLDPRAKLAGGIAIVHGMGTVIGAGSVVGAGTVIYHGVTLGIKGSRKLDGFPTIGTGCVLGAGCKILGGITVGDGCVVGANVVLTESLPPGSLARVPAPIVVTLKPEEFAARTAAVTQP